LKTLQLPYSENLLRKIHSWLRQQPMAVILNGNDYTYPQQPFPLLMAGGSKAIPVGDNWQDAFLKKNPASWYFGYLGYDLKGRAEDESREAFIGFPEQGLFEAEAVFEKKGNFVQLHSADPESLYSDVQNLPEYQPQDLPEFPPFRPAVSKQAYLHNVEKVKQLIREGDVYELNLCQYFESNAAPDGLDFYLRLNQLFPMPFSGWFKSGHLEIASGSPERFLRKTGNELISQPIKGTAARGRNEEEDRQNRERLFHSEKERAENMMIVDLVRNDLAKVSRTGSTTVEEMFGIYAFPTVFQMISTVRSVKAADKNMADVLDSAFPMGSMTGAPKLEVMKQIRSLEPVCRGAYSGALGCMHPDGDFDFNVLIRSLFINHGKNQCGFAVGSAITIDSDTEEEWAECMAKAAALLKVCGNPGLAG
jgi:para-aminobenzoate synthetase component 1